MYYFGQFSAKIERKKIEMIDVDNHNNQCYQNYNFQSKTELINCKHSITN